MTRNTNIVTRLSLVARYGRSAIFIGWNKDGNVTSSDTCSEEVKKDFLAAKESGAEFPSIPSDSLICYEYSSLGKAIDYPPSKEDVITINIKDQLGNSDTISLGEGTILKAIEWSLQEENIWNGIMDAKDDGSGVTSAIEMHTILFQDGRVQNGTICALLFKPLMIGQPNKAAFLKFAKSVVKQLLIIDESQEAGQRKGYIQLAAQASNTSIGKLTSLIFDVSDPETAEKVVKAKESGIKLLKNLGIIEVTKKEVEDLTQSLPNYDIDKLTLKSFSGLVSAMRELAPYRNRSR